MTYIANYGLVGHGFHVLRGDYVDVASGSDEYVSLRCSLVHGYYFEAFHCGL